MKPTDDPDKLKSTLVLKAQQAMSLSEIESFVRDIETRPLDRFVADLPSLLELPEGKFSLVAMVFRKRFQFVEEAGRIQLETRLREILDTPATDEKILLRCRVLLEREG